MEETVHTSNEYGSRYPRSRCCQIISLLSTKNNILTGNKIYIHALIKKTNLLEAGRPPSLGKHKLSEFHVMCFCVYLNIGCSFVIRYNTSTWDLCERLKSEIEVQFVWLSTRICCLSIVSNTVSSLTFFLYY